MESFDKIRFKQKKDISEKVDSYMYINVKLYDLRGLIFFLEISHNYNVSLYRKFHKICM